MPSAVPPLPRKRTTSFCDPPLRKSTRAMLRRTDSFLSLSDAADESYSFLHLAASPPPAPRTTRPRPYGEARKPGRRRPEFTLAPAASGPKRPSRAAPKPESQPAAPHARTSSPLAPSQKLLPPRQSFPRSKPEPDLYRTALKGQMRSSPEGEKILRMGPRLAIAILSATRELERIVSAHEDDDVMMADDTDSANTSAAWGLGRDRVAVPCGA